MLFQFMRLKTFFHLKLTAELLIRGLTACVSCQGVSHLFRGRFVYVGIIQNGLQLVTVDSKLKKLPSDKAACDDSLCEYIIGSKSWSLCCGNNNNIKLIVVSLHPWLWCRCGNDFSLGLLGCQPVKSCSETCLKGLLIHLKEFGCMLFYLMSHDSVKTAFSKVKFLIPDCRKRR